MSAFCMAQLQGYEVPFRSKPQSLRADPAIWFGRLRQSTRVQRLARMATHTIALQYALAAVLLLSIDTHDVMAAASTASFQVGITIGGPQFAPPKVTAPRKPRYTWGAAEISLRREGYTVSRWLSKSGDLYWFEAANVEGRVRAAVSVTSGEIVSLVH